MVFKHLRDGWLNYLKSLFNHVDEDVKAEAERRGKICVNCRQIHLSYVGKNLPIRGFCKLCKCAFPAMLFAPKKECPLKKWRIKKDEDDDFYTD